MVHSGSGGLGQLHAGGTAQILQAIGGWAVSPKRQDRRPGRIVILARHLAAFARTAAKVSLAQGSHFEAWTVAFPDMHRDASIRPQDMAARAGAEELDVYAHLPPPRPPRGTHAQAHTGRPLAGLEPKVCRCAHVQAYTFCTHCSDTCSEGGECVRRFFFPDRIF